MDDVAADLILDLLDDERAAILAGAFDRLDRMAARKEALFTRLAEEAVPPSRLARIARSVGRNQRLLAASLAGLREAGARLKVLRSVRDSFSSYDARGTLAVLPQVPPAFERKA